MADLAPKVSAIPPLEIDLVSDSGDSDTNDLSQLTYGLQKNKFRFSKILGTILNKYEKTSKNENDNPGITLAQYIQSEKTEVVPLPVACGYGNGAVDSVGEESGPISSIPCPQSPLLDRMYNHRVSQFYSQVYRQPLEEGDGNPSDDCNVGLVTEFETDFNPQEADDSNFSSSVVSNTPRTPRRTPASVRKQKRRSSLQWHDEVINLVSSDSDPEGKEEVALVRARPKFRRRGRKNSNHLNHPSKRSKGNESDENLGNCGDDELDEGEATQDKDICCLISKDFLRKSPAGQMSETNWVSTDSRCTEAVHTESKVESGDPAVWSGDTSAAFQSCSIQLPPLFTGCGYQCMRFATNYHQGSCSCGFLSWPTPTCVETCQSCTCQSVCQPVDQEASANQHQCLTCGGQFTLPMQSTESPATVIPQSQSTLCSPTSLHTTSEPIPVVDTDSLLHLHEHSPDVLDSECAFFCNKDRQSECAMSLSSVI